ESLREAVSALPRQARWELAWADRAGRVGHFTGITGEAVAAHLAVDDIPGAVEVAEHGRSVLLSGQLDLHTDVSALHRVRPDLAARFEHVRDSLDTGADLPARTGDEIRAAQGWLQDSTWTNLLAEIRSLPGFAGFLAAPGWAELRQAGSAGAVVVVNAQFGNSAAILLRDGAPVAVPLDHLSLADVRRYAGALLRADQEDLTRIVPEMLAWLWESINEPVLAALGHTTTPGANQQWPRVWWLPIGSLGVLPLHAAGFTPDRVISSYTPTIRALLRARRPPAGARRHLAVAMSRTPGQAALPGAVAETMTLPDAVRLTDSDAVADRVLAALRESTWAHFACHATGDNTAAGLLLYDRPLLVADIARAGGQDAELAYLSACSTARAGRRSPDEAIHLASAFQLAGYRHVIGSLWPLQDTVATFAGQRFYQLVQNADTAAQALHQLTLELRTYYPYRPDTWAPLIHSGP
ncbi:MAG: CHAT domain-containing protein, partial [Kibdelosporangium sp.]